MKKNKIIFLFFSLIFVFSGCSQSSEKNSRENGIINNNQPAQTGQISECEKAGGVISLIEECDGSESRWCKISEKEECYAEQVSGGKCVVGKYDEELGGVVGITPRVLCDGNENGQ